MITHNLDANILHRRPLDPSELIWNDNDKLRRLITAIRKYKLNSIMYLLENLPVKRSLD